MILGVDFDNTLVCYDGMFYAAAVERGFMPDTGPQDKRGVRRYLCERNQEQDFVLLQGYVYGQKVMSAQPYPGALDVLRRLRDSNVGLILISHKTAFPHAGPSYDLRQRALDWLRENDFFELFGVGGVFFEETMDEKASRVSAARCTHFVDDMERFLTHPLLPSGLNKILFHPPGGEEVITQAVGLATAGSWLEVEGWLGMNY